MILSSFQIMKAITILLEKLLKKGEKEPIGITESYALAKAIQILFNGLIMPIHIKAFVLSLRYQLTTWLK